MRKRRRIEYDHENHDRWLISYADFITLLFAFFVVMYAISAVNEGKYRVFSLFPGYRQLSILKTASDECLCTRAARRV